MKTIILGCGPAGLIAAHAAKMAGSDVAIFSKKRKSFMNGAQYLHELIPLIGARSFDIDYQLQGSPEAYRFKVYGSKWDGVVSPEELLGIHPAFDIRDTYDQLWEMYNEFVVEWEATPAGLYHLITKYEPNFLVSSIPAPVLCRGECTFRSARIYSTNKLLQGIPDNTVVCNGFNAPAWYRASRINGFENTEWSTFVPRPPIQPMWDVIKPIDHNCICLPEMVAEASTKFLRVGRYGKWKKGVLSHHGYQEVFDALNAS